LAQDDDEPSVRDEAMNTSQCLGILQVQRAALAANRPTRHLIEQLLVGVALPYVLSEDPVIAGTGRGTRGTTVAQKELRLLDP